MNFYHSSELVKTNMISNSNVSGSLGLAYSWNSKRIVHKSDHPPKHSRRVSNNEAAAVVQDRAAKTQVATQKLYHVDRCEASNFRKYKPGSVTCSVTAPVDNSTRPTIDSGPKSWMYHSEDEMTEVGSECHTDITDAPSITLNFDDKDYKEKPLSSSCKGSPLLRSTLLSNTLTPNNNLGSTPNNNLGSTSNNNLGHMQFMSSSFNRLSQMMGEESDDSSADKQTDKQTDNHAHKTARSGSVSSTNSGAERHKKPVLKVTGKPGGRVIQRMNSTQSETTLIDTQPGNEDFPEQITDNKDLLNKRKSLIMGCFPALSCKIR